MLFFFLPFHSPFESVMAEGCQVLGGSWAVASTCTSKTHHQSQPSVLHGLVSSTTQMMMYTYSHEITQLFSTDNTCQHKMFVCMFSRDPICVVRTFLSVVILYLPLTCFFNFLTFSFFISFLGLYCTAPTLFDTIFSNYFVNTLPSNNWKH